jgi:hypothetical protein
MFIAAHILKYIVDIRGSENVESVTDSNPMSEILENMEDSFLTIIEELEQGDFWDEYTEDCKVCPDYDYNTFRQAIRNANKQDQNIAVTNFMQGFSSGKDLILNEYIKLYKSERP